MTAELKLRTLAASDATLQSYLLGTNGTFRWFDRQLPPKYITEGACVRVLRVSTGPRSYFQDRISQLSNPMFQIDVLDYDAEEARAVVAAITTWLTTVDLASGDQFGSPPVTPPQAPSFVENQRAGMDYQIQPPAYVETIQVRIFNMEDQ